MLATQELSDIAYDSEEYDEEMADTLERPEATGGTPQKTGRNEQDADIVDEAALNRWARRREASTWCRQQLTR